MNIAGVVSSVGQNQRRAAPTASSVAATLTVSRTSGPAPLAVFADAVLTTSSKGGLTDPFRQIVYSWDSGEPGAGTYATTGASKNTKVGAPLFARVYDTPGTYTLTLQANDGQSTDTKTATITVDDPDVTFASTATVCISPTANYTGAKAGATTQTTIPTIASNKRYLLHAGETFGAIIIPQGVTNVQVGRYGTGANPIADLTNDYGVQINNGRPGTGAYSDGITVMDIDVHGGVSQVGTVYNMLLHRLTLNQPGETANNSVFICINNTYYAFGDVSRVRPLVDFRTNKNIFVSECVQSGSVGADPYPITGLYMEDAQCFAILGSSFDKAREHNMRLAQVTKCVIDQTIGLGHSSDGIRHSVKLHSTGMNAFDDNWVPRGGEGHDGPPVVYDNFFASRYVSIHNGRFGSADDNNSWAVAIRPQNANEFACELISDVMVENCIFTQGTGGSWVALNIAGQRVTSIGNTMSGGGAADSNISSTTTGYSTLLVASLTAHQTSRA